MNLGEALLELHEKLEFIHSDIRPEYIMLSEDYQSIELTRFDNIAPINHKEKCETMVVFD